MAKKATVWDDNHTNLKVEAAKEGVTLERYHNALLKHALRLIAAGKIRFVPATESRESAFRTVAKKN